jgi:hypothetical protein
VSQNPFKFESYTRGYRRNTASKSERARVTLLDIAEEIFGLRL